MYADDKAIAFKELEDIMNKDLVKLSKYIVDWRLKPNASKTVHCIFYDMILSIAEYCAPMMMNSAHVKMVGTQINVALRIIIAAVDSTPISWLYVIIYLTLNDKNLP